MTDETLYYDEDFIITLTIEGTPYEEVKIRVNNPHETIRYQINSIVQVFELPKMNVGENYIQYVLARDVDDAEPRILDFEDEDGHELTLLDYNIKPGDKLSLLAMPYGSGIPNITVIFDTSYRDSGLLTTESETLKVFLNDWHISVGDFIKEVVLKYSLPLFHNHHCFEYSLHLNSGMESIICDTNSTLNDYLKALTNDHSDNINNAVDNVAVYLCATKTNRRNIIGSLLNRWNNYKRRIIYSKFLLIQ